MIRRDPTDPTVRQNNKAQPVGVSLSVAKTLRGGEEGMNPPGHGQDEDADNRSVDEAVATVKYSTRHYVHVVLVG